MNRAVALRLASLLAPNADPLFAELAAYLASVTGLNIEPVEAGWEERRRLAAEGEAELVALCGALAVFDPALSLAIAPVVAPVAAGEVRPVYYTEVVVARAHPATCFAQLRGGVWAYNEEVSHSGYHAVRAHLASRGDRRGFFGRALRAGSHLAALELVLAGRADAAPIDSYVLSVARAARPELEASLRVVERIGPSPAPPLALACAVADPVRRAISRALTAMHEQPVGAQILRQHRLARWAPTTRGNYEPLRAVAAAGEGVSLV